LWIFWWAVQACFVEKGLSQISQENALSPENNKKKAEKVAFSENGSWIYLSFCYFVSTFNPELKKKFDP
jgi:hypothetical protein